MKKYILTAFGKDKPGIVASITEILYKKGANIEDSSMSRLSNQFVIMLLFTSENLISKEDFKLENIEVYINQVEEEEVSKPSVCNVIISIYGADKAGIVYKVSKLLASKNINITDLRTHKLKDIYIMLMEAELKDISLSSLEKSLKELSRELNVDISLQEVCKEVL
ncbi:glycine cleavage system transcriptional repressor [Hydrogenobaculum acidophilum]